MSESLTFLNRAAMGKKIDSLKGRLETARADIQHVAVSAMVHAAEHGDLSYCTKLVNAVNASQATQLRKFFAGFAPVRWDKSKGCFVKVKKGGAFKVSDAMEISWDAYQKVQVSSNTYDADAVRKSLLKTLERVGGNAAEHGDADTLRLVANMADLLQTSIVQVKVAA